MSKRNRQHRRNETIYTIQNEHRRQELEWRYSEANEQQLETLRNALIFVWLLCSFAFAFLLTSERDIIIWAGAAGVLLVISYQIRSLWLGKIAEDRIDAELGKKPGEN